MDLSVKSERALKAMKITKFIRVLSIMLSSFVIFVGYVTQYYYLQSDFIDMSFVVFYSGLVALYVIYNVFIFISLANAKKSIEENKKISYYAFFVLMIASLATFVTLVYYVIVFYFIYAYNYEIQIAVENNDLYNYQVK